jgi:hypothetical protein
MHLLAKALYIHISYPSHKWDGNEIIRFLAVGFRQWIKNYYNKGFSQTYIRMAMK